MGETDDIQDSFNIFWNDPLSVSVDNIVDSNIKIETDFEDFHQYACNPENFLPVIRKQIEDMPIVFDSMRKAGYMHWS